MNLKSNDQDFDFQRFQKQVKQQVFQATKNYLKYCESFSPFVFYFLILVESLQILWFSIHPELKFLGQPLLLHQVRVGIEYLQFEQLIRQNNDLLQPLLILTSCAMAIHVFTIVCSIKLAFNSKEHKKLLKIFYKIGSVQIILLNTILTIPFFNVCIITLYCQPNSVYYINRTQKTQCYDLEHIILCVPAAISLLCILMESFFFWFIFYTKNPFSRCYYAMSGNLCRLARVAVKLLPPIYFLIDPSQEFQRIYIFFILAMGAAYLVMIRYFGEANFCSKNYHVEIFIENILLWFTINNIINFYLDGQDKSNSFAFIEAIFCSILFAYAIHAYDCWLTQKFFIANMKGDINKNNMVRFMYLLIDMYINGSTVSNIDKFVCLEQLNQNLRDKSMDIKQFLAKRNIQSQKSQQVLGGFFLRLVDVFAENNKTLELKFIRINFLSISGSNVTALYEVSDISRDKLSISDDFTIYLFKEENCIDKTSKSGFEDSERNALKIERYLQFSALVNAFEDKTEECAKISQQFWEQLCQDVPSMSKIYNLAEKSTSQKGIIRNIFRQIEEIFPENYSSLFLYFKFLNQVNMSAKQKQRIKARLAIQKNKVDTSHDNEPHFKKIRFLANENLCVASVSTTQMNFGNVINVNSEIKRLVGYEKSEIMGQKITKIMPNVYFNIHDDFIKHYLKLADETRYPIQKTVYVLKKNVTIVEMIMEIKIFSSVSSEFQLVGFFKENKGSEGTAEIMINLNNHQIIGFSRAFLTFANEKIRMEEVVKEPMKISHIFPELLILSDLYCKQEIETIFRFSDCTEKLIDLERSEMSKWGSQKVMILVKHLEYYKTCGIAILMIIKKDLDLHSLKKNETKSIMLQNFKTTNNIKVVSPDRYVNEDEEDVQIEKQINEFIFKNELENKKILMKVFFIILCLIFLFSMIGIEIFFSNSTQNILNLFQEIRLSDQVAEKIGVAAHLTQRLFDSTANTTSWNQYRLHYKQYLQQLQTDTLSLYQKVNERPGQQLVLNENKQYDFYEHFDDSSQTPIKKLADSYQDAIFRYIYAGTQLLSKQINDFIAPSIHQVTTLKVYISENSKKNFPYLSRKTSQALSSLSNSMLRDINESILCANGFKNILVVIVFTAIVIALQKLSSFLYLTFEVYNQINKSDAKIFENLCKQYYSESLIRQDSERIKQVEDIESIQIVPRSLLTVLIKALTLSINTFKLNSVNMQEGEEKQNLLVDVLQRQELSDNKQLAFSNQKINLQENNHLRFKYLIGFISMLFLILSEIVFIPMENQSTDAALEYKQGLTQIGQFSKNTIYSMYFGYQSLKFKLAKQSSPYLQLFRSQIQEFYTASSQVHHLIDQQSIKSIYKEIEAMIYLVEEAPNDLYTHSEFAIQFETLETNLLKETETVSHKRQNQLNEKGQEIILEAIKKAVIKGIVQSLLTLIFFKVVYEYIINFISCKAHRSACMMRMLPIKLINASLSFINKNIDNGQCPREEVRTI